MINGAREFALRWLLEPTKKLEEVQYEYVFRLITFPIDKQTFLVYKHVLNNGSIKTIEIETPTNLPIIQANLYKKTSQGRNHIGTVEYFSCQKDEIEDSYQTTLCMLLNVVNHLPSAGVILILHLDAQ